MGMKRLALSFAIFCLLLAGYISMQERAKFEARKAAIETELKSTFTGRLYTQGINVTCKEVSLTPDGDHEFRGMAKFSNGSGMVIYVTVDSKSGQWTYEIPLDIPGSPWEAWVRSKSR